MLNDKFKTEEYRKNESLEKLLKEINSILKKAKDTYVPSEKPNIYPKLFIVGCPRSGTTILTQWLASLNLFCYPSNFISRFYQFPYFGALIQEMLFNPKYKYKEEMEFFIKEDSFSSDVGKTKGVLEPHEFWYFWRNYFSFSEIPISNNEFLKNSDFDGFQKQLALVQNFYRKPIFMKSLIINWYIDLFYENIEKPIFLYIKRDPIDNMISLLKIRKKYLGDENKWFSFKPREYDLLSKADKYLQVAGQVYFTNKEIEKSFEKIPDKHKIIIEYNKFCNDTSDTYQKIIIRLKENDYPVSAIQNYKLSFNSLKYSPIENLTQIREAYNKVKTIKR